MQILDDGKTAYERAHENMPLCPIRDFACSTKCIFYDPTFTCRLQRFVVQVTKYLKAQP